MVVKTEQVTGDGMVHTLASAFGITGSSARMFCKWIQVLTPPGNGANVRFGGSEVGASSGGYPVPSGWFGQLFPPISEISNFYDLVQINYCAAIGDTFYIAVGLE